MRDQVSSPSSEPLSASVVGYPTTTGGFDEAVDESGFVRPAWRSLVGALARLGASEMERRRRQADRLLAAQGASHLYHDDLAVRPWRLDPVPLVLTAEEWAPLAEGIAQRAELLDAVAVDLYGERRLLAEGVVPVEAVVGSRAYQWPAVGRAGLGRRLVVYAVDLVRTTDGAWRVLRDLTDAQTGPGYALLNRTVLSRVLPEIYRELGVVRLSEFFDRLRAALGATAPGDRSNPRTVVLTSGIGHPGFFEHSFLAEQLGYNLAEGGDLAVREGRLWLRSLAGFEPVDVLLRRVDDGEADPLEIGDGGGAGVPGLLHAVRQGGVGVANAVGTGVVGSLTLQPFLPAACRRLLGRDLMLPALPTRWCGDPTQRAEVRATLETMVLHEAGSTSERRTVFGGLLDDAGRELWLARMEAEPASFVAQEKAAFATAPTLAGEAVVPGTLVLRAAAVLGPDGIEVLPGGLGRVLDPSVPAVTQTSGLAKDVWVVEGDAGRRRPGGSARGVVMPQIDLRASLPTRAAEALFWVGRHAERAEAIARLVRAVVAQSAQDPDLVDVDWVDWVAAGLRAARGLPSEEPGRSRRPDLLPPEPRLEAELAEALTGPGGLAEHLALLRRTASAVREFMSSTTWQLLGGLADAPASRRGVRRAGGDLAQRAGRPGHGEHGPRPVVAVARPRPAAGAGPGAAGCGGVDAGGRRRTRASPGPATRSCWPPTRASSPTAAGIGATPAWKR